MLHVENVRFSGQNFELLENCFTTSRALESDFVGVEGRKMILSMSPSELVQRSAVNGLGFGLYQLQVPYTVQEPDSALCYRIVNPVRFRGWRHGSPRGSSTNYCCSAVVFDRNGS